MKQTFFKILKVTALAAVIMVSVSYISVLAFNGPTSAGDLPAPVNTSDIFQIKKGGITAKFFWATAQPMQICRNCSVTDLGDGVITGKVLAKGYNGLFTKQVFFSGPNAELKIGNTINTPATTLPSNPTNPLFDMSTYNTPLTIDLNGRGASTPTGKNAMELLSGNSCLSAVTTVVNTSAINFQKKDGTPVDIVARQVRLSGGAPDAGKVLLSTNPNGDAVWATLKVIGGQITYDYSGHTPTGTDSPVTGGQQCTP